MIKKIQIELALIGILILNILVSSVFDIKFYSIFYSLDFSLNSPFLKEFFKNITELGSSLWYFLLSIFLFIICYILEKLIEKKETVKKLKKISLLFFSSVLVTGIITQLIKHLIGRPRPSYANQLDSYGISFFNLDSAFHSFPSGHTSTIFIVAFVLSFLIPNLKYFFLFLAFIVGFSRVVVGAHYMSDVLGGIIVASIGLKITFIFFNNYKNIKMILNEIKLDFNLFSLCLIALLILIIFISVGNSLDIFVSELFFLDNNVFVLQSLSYITILAREFFLPFLILYILIFPIIGLYIPISKIYFNFVFDIKKIIFTWLFFLFNNLVIVNLLLKSFWGRARPNEISTLGGKEDFSPWFQITDACNSNCSFVSGDASVGFSLIILFFLTGNKKFFWMAIISGFFLGSIRILEGGHFLSDILLASFIIFTLTYLQFFFYKRFSKNVL